MKRTLKTMSSSGSKSLSEPIVFFGSGPVAAASLKALAENFVIEAVITKQAPGHHRGPVPVTELARELKLPLYFANKNSELSDLIIKSGFESRLGVIVDYGVIVSHQVIEAFPLGIINSHFSLLPQWRGADPITFTVLSGQPESGVSLMLIVEALDEGPLLSQEKLVVPPDIRTPELTNRLVALSNRMLLRDIPRYLNGNLTAFSQANSPATYSRKLTKADGVLDPTGKTAEELEREVRAFIEWPKSRLQVAGKDVIVTKAHVADYSQRPTPTNQLFVTPEGFIALPTLDKALIIERLKPAGKHEMSASEFLRGNPLQ